MKIRTRACKSALTLIMALGFFILMSLDNNIIVAKVSATTWYKEGGSVVFSKSDGKCVYYKNKKKYPLSDHVIKLGSEYYYYKNGNKIVKKGWIKTDNCKLFVLNSEGKLATGLRIIDGKNYYFDDKARLLTSCWKTIGKTQYYLCNDGHVAIKEIVKIDGTKYYFREDGTHVKCAKNWVSGKRYYEDDYCTLEDIIVNSGFDSISFESNGERLDGKATGASGDTIYVQVYIDKKTKLPNSFFISYKLEYSRWLDRIDYRDEILSYSESPYSATYVENGTGICYYYDYEDHKYTRFWILNSKYT